VDGGAIPQVLVGAHAAPGRTRFAALPVPRPSS